MQHERRRRLLPPREQFSQQRARACVPGLTFVPLCLVAADARTEQAEQVLSKRWARRGSQPVADPELYLDVLRNCLNVRRRRVVLAPCLPSHRCRCGCGSCLPRRTVFCALRWLVSPCTQCAAVLVPTPTCPPASCRLPLSQMELTLMVVTSRPLPLADMRQTMAGAVLLLLCSRWPRGQVQLTVLWLQTCLHLVA